MNAVTMCTTISYQYSHSKRYAKLRNQATPLTQPTTNNGEPKLVVNLADQRRNLIDSFHWNTHCGAVPSRPDSTEVGIQITFDGRNPCNHQLTSSFTGTITSVLTRLPRDQRYIGFHSNGFHRLVFMVISEKPFGPMFMDLVLVL